MKYELLPCKLMGDVVYPIRLWFYSHFKDEKDGLSRAHAHWKFIQSSIRMAVESFFDILKKKVEDSIEQESTCLSDIYLMWLLLAFVFTTCVSYTKTDLIMNRQRKEKKSYIGRIQINLDSWKC
jgi:hypothetical protein